MTQYSKPAVRDAWGLTAGASNLQDPGNTYASTGWPLGAKPPRQYMNWVLNSVMGGIRYLCQSGIPDWDAAETYQYAQYVKDSNGYIYRSQISNNTNNIPANTLGTAWSTPAVQTPNAAVGTWQVPNIQWVSTNFLAIGSTFGAIAGQISAGQVPVGAVTQWQGSLSIGGAQVTSAVSGANTLYNTSGNYATFNWAGQSGQPSWVWGSNDGANYYVWNPSNFSVNNSALLAGFAPSPGAGGNTVGVRDSGGNFYAGYFHSSNPNGENPSISQFVVTNGDGWHRFADVPTAKAALGALGVGDFPALLSANGYQKFPTGVILQWGSAFISGTSTVNFPLTFPNGVSRVVFTNINSTNQIYLSSLAASGFTATNGSSTISWLAMGY